MVAEVVSSLALGSRRSSALALAANLAMSTPMTTNALPMRLYSGLRSGRPSASFARLAPAVGAGAGAGGSHWVRCSLIARDHCGDTDLLGRSICPQPPRHSAGSRLEWMAHITPGDDRLRRGRSVGVVASRGPGRPRKTPGKPIR